MNRPNGRSGMHRLIVMALVAVLGGIFLFAMGFYLIRDAWLIAGMMSTSPKDEMAFGAFFLGLGIIAFGVVLLISGTALILMFPLIFRKDRTPDH